MNSQSTTMRKKYFLLPQEVFFKKLNRKIDSPMWVWYKIKDTFTWKIIMSNATSLQFDCIGPIHKEDYCSKIPGITFMLC